MTTKTEPQFQEFTLPFVGREEELQFLLDEYDQMLYAQYRSVWIEAPAGTGKTALVEEFLRRIQHVPDMSSRAQRDGISSLQPWIVHAHLRERSSNSLASFVEALGVTLQTLTESQREKLFSGLTSFYQERARKIVGGGNVQSMDMEEAITTAGYILKRLSYHFTLVIIIEDIHVLKDEISFYALRHFQAIVEHVPMVMVFISRPIDENHLKQFRDLSIKEGCKKCELGGLQHEDVKRLLQYEGEGKYDDRTTNDEQRANELLHLSGGNPLLLRELLRSDLVETDEAGSTTEKIVQYLTKELERLPKKERQIIAIAGMLGEEFSEQLLYEISSDKDFKCWSDESLQRFERKGIIRRRKKVLKHEDGGKEISLRVAVFSHALWWEAARKLYEHEKVWRDQKFAETIVPLLSQEDYPLLTDAELLMNVLRSLPRKKSVPFLRYITNLCSTEAKWNFHSAKEQKDILHEVHRCIVELLRSRWFHLDKQTMWSIVYLLDAEKFLAEEKESLSELVTENHAIITSLLSSFVKDDNEALRGLVSESFDEGFSSFYRFGDLSHFKKTYQCIISLKKSVKGTETHLQNFLQAFLDGVEGCRQWYKNPVRAAKLFCSGVERFDLRGDIEKNFAGIYLMNITNLPVPLKDFNRYLPLASALRKACLDDNAKDFFTIIAYKAEIGFCLKLGKVSEAVQRADELRKIAEKTWRIRNRISAYDSLLQVYSLVGNDELVKTIVDDLFSKASLWYDKASLFKIVGGNIFRVEDFLSFETMWKESRWSLLSHNMPIRIPILCRAQALLSLLNGNEKGFAEAQEVIRKMVKKFPMMKEAAQDANRFFNIFLGLKNKKLVITKRQFEEYLHSEKLGSFEKYHLQQIFARIGVRLGHPTKEFSHYVRQSLEGFAQLGLSARVIFTATKFSELNLISEKELQQITRKFGLPKPRQNIVIKERQLSVENYARNKNGVFLHYLGEVAASDPSATSIRKQRWGTRQSSSLHKHLIALLVNARLEKKILTRQEILSELYPKVDWKNVGERKAFQLSRRLSVFLPQLRAVFSPHTVVEKIGDGYQLHSSVRVDIEEVLSLVFKAKTLTESHPINALSLLIKAHRGMNRGEFFESIAVETKSIVAMRKKIDTVRTEITTLSKTLEKKVVL